jgi:hypothetical protein
MSAQKTLRKEWSTNRKPHIHMNLIAENPLSKTRDLSGHLVLFPIAHENGGKQPTSRISREAMQAFSNAQSDNARSGHFSVPASQAPEKYLALGVLKQAARDLRRFNSANSGVKQELYLDAYSWVTANDFSWPYSFVNVCKLLNVCPEGVRAELFADASLGWFDYWAKRAGCFSQKVRASFARAFAGDDPESTEASQLASTI